MSAHLTVCEGLVGNRIKVSEEQDEQITAPQTLHQKKNSNLDQHVNVDVMLFFICFDISLIHPLFENVIPVLHHFLCVFIFTCLFILQHIPLQLSQREMLLLKENF